MSDLLAEEPGLGKVALCRACARVHVSCGSTAVSMSKENFLKLCRMIQEASAHRLLNGDGRATLVFEDGHPVATLH